MFFVYVLRDDVTQKLYIGSCENLERRMREHQLKRPTYRLIYHESRGTRSEAFQREMFFKTGNGRKVLKGLLAQTKV
jgi:putative endonuclease